MKKSSALRAEWRSMHSRFLWLNRLPMTMNTSLPSKLALCQVFFALTLILGAPHASSQDIQWQPDVQSAIEKAEADNKLVLLHFTASWCRPCQALEKFVFPNLEVARLVNEHVVATQIDVDQQQNLVTEYGVTAVPFDVVITPGGRIITKQKSPLDSSGYQRLMAGLSTPIKELEDQSKVALAQQLNEFSNQFDFKPAQLSKFKDHTPETPTHTAPVASAQSAQLARRNNRVANPFFRGKISGKESSPGPQPKTISNSFATLIAATNSDQSNNSMAKTVSNEFAAPIQADVNELASSGSNDSSLTVNSNSFEPNEIELEPPTINSEFKQITGSEQEQAFQVGQKSNAKLTPKVSTEIASNVQPGPQVNALLNPKTRSDDKPKVSGFAANVPPLTVHQDRFFQVTQTPKVKPINQTRVVKPTNLAQALLKPIDKIAKRTQQPSNQTRRQVNFPATQRPLANKTTDRSALAINTQPAAGLKVQKLLQPQQPMQVKTKNVASKHVASKRKTPNAQVARKKPAVALKGKCPVTLLQDGKWVDGDAKYGCVHRDRLYLFADGQKLKEFRSNPDQFSPVLAGYDPVVFHKEGQLVEGLAEHGVFMGKGDSQQILLFRNAESRALFQANPAAYMNSVRQAMQSTGNPNSPLMR
jgi:thiol-disulfide isomerase/thioredoxin